MSLLIESGRVSGDGRTSYQVLADRVAPARKVLDLGCGGGALLTVFARNGAETLAGVDLSEGQLALARKRPELAGAELRQGRAQELPFADGAFHAVVSHMAFMLMDDPETVAAEVARVLEPRGTFAIVVGGPDSTGAARVFLELARPLFQEVPATRRPTYTVERAGIDEDQRTRLRSAFFAETEQLRTADGRLPAGLCANLAKTRLFG